MANERAGIAEEEYRKKSTEFKTAQKEITALKARLAALESKQPIGNSNKGQGDKMTTKKENSQSSKKVRWSFDPEDGLSQPFWDHSNEYSRYIANMIAATVTTLPNIPMQTAISTALETVRAAGPAILSQPPRATAQAAAPPTASTIPQPNTSTNADAKRPSSPGIGLQK